MSGRHPRPSGQLDNSHPFSARKLFGWPEPGHQGMLAEELPDHPSEGSGSPAMNHPDRAEAGQVGIIKVSLKPPKGFISGEAPQLNLGGGRGAGDCDKLNRRLPACSRLGRDKLRTGSLDPERPDGDQRLVSIKL